MATIFSPRLFPNDEDAEARRKRILMLAQGGDPNQDPGLDTDFPKRELPPVDGNIDSATPPPVAAAATGSRPRFSDPVRQGREEFVYRDADPSGRVPRTFGGTLKAAGVGALTGLGRGGIAGGLGGAAAGAIQGIVSPRRAREAEFEMFKRPGIEESEAYKRHAEERERKLRGEQLDTRVKEATIGNLDSQAKARMIPKPQAQRTTDFRAVDINGQPAFRDLKAPGNENLKPYFKPPEPKEPKSYAPHWIDDNDGNQYNLNDPAERKRYDSLPRSKKVKPRAASGQFTSERKEKDIAATKARAATDIEQLEALARKAIEADEADRGPMLNEMRARVNSMRAQYGDVIETGEHNNWPFARLRSQGSPQTRAPQAGASAKSVTRAELQEYADSSGMTFPQAMAEAQRKGYKVQ